MFTPAIHFSQWLKEVHLEGHAYNHHVYFLQMTLFMPGSLMGGGGGYCFIIQTYNARVTQITRGLGSFRNSELEYQGTHCCLPLHKFE